LLCSRGAVRDGAPRSRAFPVARRHCVVTCTGVQADQDGAGDVLAGSLLRRELLVVRCAVVLGLLLPLHRPFCGRAVALLELRFDAAADNLFRRDA
jgi:hypothetical protein